MIITEATLPAIEATEDDFVKFYTDFAREIMADACLLPLLNKQRIVAAYAAWKADLARIEDHEPELHEGLDHFKRAGHLTYWARRMSPVIDANEPSFDLYEAHEDPIEESERVLRQRMFGLWNEYIAFEIGLQICKFYEVGQPGAIRGITFFPATDYYDTMCHFLKLKNVSPHALFLIFKSLFAK